MNKLVGISDFEETIILIFFKKEKIQIDLDIYWIEIHSALLDTIVIHLKKVVNRFFKEVPQDEEKVLVMTIRGVSIH